MTKTMIWDANQRKMVAVQGRNAGETIKVSIPISLYATFKELAKRDGYDLKGISYETEKDKEGKTKKDAKGNTVYKTDKDGNKIKHTVEESTGKINSAVSQYLVVAANEFLKTVKTS